MNQLLRGCTFKDKSWCLIHEQECYVSPRYYDEFRDMIWFYQSGVIASSALDDLNELIMNIVQLGSFARLPWSEQDALVWLVASSMWLQCVLTVLTCSFAVALSKRVCQGILSVQAQSQCKFKWKQWLGHVLALGSLRHAVHELVASRRPRSLGSWVRASDLCVLPLDAAAPFALPLCWPRALGWASGVRLLLTS